MWRKMILEALALYLRRAPWEAGRWRLLRLALPMSRQAYTAPSVQRVATRLGFRLQVDTQDWMGRHVYVSGEYEPATGQVIKALLRPGDVFLDIGANIGYFSMLASQRVGPGGRVYAFEPFRAVREQLEQNVALNQCANVEVRPEAVADRAGELEFYAGPPDHRGISSLRCLEEASAVTRVQACRLDDLLSDLARLDVIKLDVEGAELLALRGARGLLARHHPEVIVEVTDEYLHGLGSTASELRAFMRGLGYAMFGIDHDGLAAIADADPLPAAQFNALFTVRTPAALGLRVKTGWGG